MTEFTRPSANILLEAAELQERKGRDYQNPLSRGYCKRQASSHVLST